MKRATVGLGTCAWLLFSALPAAAQTQIVADTGPAITTGTTTERAGTTTLIDGGQRVGNNLFHSFATFSLGTGETALWFRAGGDGASIANIINRVTGGSVSMIDGTIASDDMGNANFFFINPAGVIFGSNASVAVPNAAHFSTAANLRFADGGVFGVTTPGGSVFSMAAPSAFGFLGSQGNIRVDGVGPAFAGGDTKLSLSAANISINNANFVPGGLDLFALGGANRTLALGAPMASRFGAGNIEINNSFISVQPSTRHDGRVRVNAGRLSLTDTIFASDSNTQSAAGMQLLVGDVVLRGTPAGNQQTYLGSFAPGDGDAATVDIDALRIFASNGSQISSQALFGANGNAGTIRIRTGLLAMDSGASIVSSAYGDSLSGLVDITADAITMASGALIETTTFGAGQGGDVVIKAGTITMDNSVIAAEAEDLASGSAGIIKLSASTLALDNGARISSSNLGSGFGGAVEITGDTITLRNGSRIEADALGPRSGGAGFVSVTGRLIRVESGSEISSVTEGVGDAGAVLVTADNLVIDGGLLNSASLGGTGAAGIILVAAKSLEMHRGGEITTSTRGSGAAGLIEINAHSITMTGASEITSETFADGSAGDIVIEGLDGVAPDISLTGGARIASAQTGANATGDAGFVSIRANRLFLGPSATPAISTSVANGGLAGVISINAKTVTLDGAEIASAATGLIAGTAGAIEVTADLLTIINGGRIESTSFSPGPAGGIGINVGTLVLRGAGSEITSENLSARGGLAGSILVNAGRIEVLEGAAISTNSIAGPAGDITLNMPRTGTLLLRGAGQSGLITTSSGPGTGGLITIASPFLILSDGGQILALGEEFGADVAIQSNFYIRSSDRLNLLSVDGSLLLDSEIGDLSTGAEQIDLSFLDASAVLRGQCAASRRGGTSQLNLRATGPNAGSAPPSGNRPSPLSQSETAASCD